MSDLGHRMHSLPTFFSSLVPGHAGPAALVGLGASVASLLPLAYAWRRVRGEDTLPLLWTFTSLVGVLVDPHIFDYDLSVLVLAGLVWGSATPGARVWLAGFYLLMFLRLPIPFGDGVLQPTVPFMLAACLAVWRQMGLPVPFERWTVAASASSARQAPSPAERAVG